MLQTSKKTLLDYYLSSKFSSRCLTYPRQNPPPPPPLAPGGQKTRSEYDQFLSHTISFLLIILFRILPVDDR